MNSSLDDLIKELANRINPETPKLEKLITSGKRFSHWITDRVHQNDQIVINAIECPESEMQNTLRHVMMEIEKELSGITKVKILPYPYDSIEEMRKVIDGLIAHFDAHISADDVIVSIGTSLGRSELISGYIILTIMSNPIII
jgi:hypothetical protein